MITLTSSLSNKERVRPLSKARSFVRWAVWALPVWAAFLFFSTITYQPDPQTDFAGFAAYVTTSQFLISHLLFSIGGAAIGSIGVIGLMFYPQGTKAAGKVITGMVTTVMGNTLTASVFGAAALVQPAMGRRSRSSRRAPVIP